jgi:mono/diheme cytochrome c family protein
VASRNRFLIADFGGALAPMGMESFADTLSEQDVENIHAYIVNESWQA